MEEAVGSSELRVQLSEAMEALRKAEERAVAGQAALELLHAIAIPLEALGYLFYLVGESAEEPENMRKYIGLAEEQLTTLNQLVGRSFSLA